MPPTEPKLTVEEVGKIRNWIDHGIAQGQAFAGPPVTDKEVVPIFQLRCTKCHGKRRTEGELDLAGYADSEGVIDEDRPRKYSWRYRDYVIRAFNSDKPYDRFLHEQLAGDELIDYENVEEVTQEVVDTLAATGFLRLTPDGTYASCPDGETSLDLSTPCRAADAQRVPRGNMFHRKSRA